MTEQSRSVQRRIAAQKGLPAPDFSKKPEPPEDKVEAITLRLEDFLKVYDGFVGRTISKDVLKQAVSDFPREILALFPEPELELLTGEEINNLQRQWESEYEDIAMTDAEWEAKRDHLLIQAQLDKDRKAIRGE